MTTVADIAMGDLISVGWIMGALSGRIDTTDGLTTLYIEDASEITPLELSPGAPTQQRGGVWYL